MTCSARIPVLVWWADGRRTAEERQKNGRGAEDLLSSGGRPLLRRRLWRTPTFAALAGVVVLLAVALTFGAPAGTPRAWPGPDLLALVLIMLVAPGLLYASVLAGVLAGVTAWLLRRVRPPWWGEQMAQVAQALWLALVTSVLLFAVLVADYGTTAAHLRRNPAIPGQVQGEALLMLHDWAKPALYRLYATALLLSGVMGFACGRLLAGRGRAVAIATAGALLVFMGLTLGMVDFFTACTVGRPFFTGASC